MEKRVDSLEILKEDYLVSVDSSCSLYLDDSPAFRFSDGVIFFLFEVGKLIVMVLYSFSRA